MDGIRRGKRVQQFASDFVVGLAISLVVLGLSCFSAGQAWSAPVVATESGAIVVEGRPIGNRGPLAQHGFDRVLNLNAVGLGKPYAKRGLVGTGPNEAEIEVAVASTTDSASGRRPVQGYMTRHERQVHSWTLAAMVLAFGLMTAITLGLWRHLGVMVDTKRRPRR